VSDKRRCDRGRRFKLARENARGVPLADIADRGDVSRCFERPCKLGMHAEIDGYATRGSVTACLTLVSRDFPRARNPERYVGAHGDTPLRNTKLPRVPSREEGWPETV
jgi:hypothetical protein